MKKSKKVEVAVRMRPLIYQYEDVEAWTINAQLKKVTSIPRSALRNVMIVNEENNNIGSSSFLGSKKKSKVQMSNVYEFACDHVFKDSQTNLEVYKQCCARVVEDFTLGQNGTIFMYGQTTSGKTYTMLGNETNEGLIIYSLRDIFSKFKMQKQTINMSYLQIYNEQINDLLNEGSINLKIEGESVQGLIQCKVSSIEEALDLLAEGEYQRAYSEKKYHDHSSRSHTIFQIKIMETEAKVKCLLNLVDLSGSQRFNEQENSQETAYINKSLFVLSNVIHKLANPKKNNHVPFRDSKLTRILAPSLTTSNNTVIICTISPAEINFSQTLSTLRFATQSRKIQLKSLDESLNESVEVNKKKMSQLLEQNELLKKNLSFAQDKQSEEKYVENRIRFIEDLITKNEISVPERQRVREWKQKVGTLSMEYEKNIEILQKQYLKAVINLTSSELNVSKESLRESLSLDCTHSSLMSN